MALFYLFDLGTGFCCSQVSHLTEEQILGRETLEMGHRVASTVQLSMKILHIS